MRFSTNLVPLRLEPSESASLGDSYHVRRVRLNLMTLIHSFQLLIVMVFPEVMRISGHLQLYCFYLDIICRDQYEEQYWLYITMRKTQV